MAQVWIYLVSKDKSLALITACDESEIQHQHSQNATRDKRKTLVVVRSCQMSLLPFLPLPSPFALLMSLLLLFPGQRKMSFYSEQIRPFEIG